MFWQNSCPAKEKMETSVVLYFDLKYKTAAAPAVKSSVKGNVSHSPVRPSVADIKNAKGTISTTPRSKDTAFPGLALSMEVK